MHITIEPRRIEITEDRGVWTFGPCPVHGTIVGMEVTIAAEKNGIVQDHWIGMQLNNLSSTANRACGQTPLVHTYGSPNDLWGVDVDFKNLEQLSVITKYVCSIDPPGSVRITRMQLRLHYVI